MCRSKEENSCVVCSEELELSIFDGGDQVVHVCTNPECPNYGLLAFSQESMPRPCQDCGKMFRPGE